MSEDKKLPLNFEAKTIGDQVLDALGIGTEDLEKHLHMQSAERQRVANMTDEEFTAAWKKAHDEGNVTAANRLVRIKALSKDDPKAQRVHEKVDIEARPGVLLHVRKDLIDSAVRVTSTPDSLKPPKPQPPKLDASVVFEGTVPLPATQEEKETYEEIRRAQAESWHAKQTEEHLAAALRSEEEHDTGWVPVTGLDGMKAAERMASAQHIHGTVAPFDLSHGLKDVKPLKESVVSTLMHIMTVREEVKDVPSEVQFALPHHKMKTLEDGTVIVDETEYEMARYVNVDMMPPELKRLISVYRTMVSGTSILPERRLADFRKAALKLVIATEEAEERVRDREARRKNRAARGEDDDEDDAGCRAA